MRAKLATALAFLLALGISGYAHRLDEYLQAAMLSVEKDRLQVSLRLIPGVAVARRVLAEIDTNRDSLLSEAEEQSYALRVLGDISLSLDSARLEPHLVSVEFLDAGEMKEGLGEIHIELTAALPAGGSVRKLIFENHHQSSISAYLVNCLVPRSKDVLITSQNRNYNQSFYELNYTDRGTLNPLIGGRQSTGSLSGFPSMFRLGMRHIAEGPDHLLFLLALLLPAPLIAFQSRWAEFAGTRRSLLQICKVVTAFTVGHSITLALAAMGMVQTPSRPIEVLIAVSILISAAHALRPLFPGREAVIAAFFGLIHGLAFAATLTSLGIGRWERITSIVGFNAGIEAMQLMVVAATMPSLILLSRTPLYPAIRIGGAIFAGSAALAWIAERLFQIHNSVDTIASAVMSHAVEIAVALLAISLIASIRAMVLPRQPASAK